LVFGLQTNSFSIYRHVVLDRNRTMQISLKWVTIHFNKCAFVIMQIDKQMVFAFMNN